MLLKKGKFMEYLEAQEVMEKQFLDMLQKCYLGKQLKVLWSSELLEIQISRKLLWK